MLSLAVVLGLVTGFGMFALLRWAPYMIRTHTEPFHMLLKHADVQAGDRVRARLEAQAARRIAMFGGASLTAICAVVGLRRRPDLVPVARRLLARSPAA